MITIARVESELDYRFSTDEPACSVLWLIGPPGDLVPELIRLAGQLGPLECLAAACAPATRPSRFSAVAGRQELLRAELGFSGPALDRARSPILRNPSSQGSVCEVVSADPAAGGIWQALTDAKGLDVCAALFRSGGTVPDPWIYSATRLVMIAGTHALNYGTASGGQDAFLQTFLTDTMKGDGLAVIRGTLELCGPGIALTGHPAAIDAAQHAIATAVHAEDQQVRHSLTLAGPWSSPEYRAYHQPPGSNRWIPA